MISNTLRMIAILIGIIFIPLQIFLKVYLQEFEHEWIVSMQSVITADREIEFMRILIRATENDFMLLLCMVLFMMSDSLIAFQCTLIYCFGLYSMVLLKLMYESPRPFWMKETIRTYNNQCDFDYGSPSQHVYNLAFFWVYCIYMYF